MISDVDSFHLAAHPELPTLELHGYLRSLVCINCQNHLSRIDFQRSLSELNPLWAAFLAEMLEAGALDTENPEERSKRGLKTHPDGDVDLPNAPYSTFRYPPCPTCFEKPPLLPDGTRSTVDVDADGAWSPVSTAGILKPAVVMFGESISQEVKRAAEEAIDRSDRILVIGSSLATYSAWRLVKRATERGLPLGVLNLGGVRGEEAFFAGIRADNNGAFGIRCNESADILLPKVVESLRSMNMNEPAVLANLPPSS
jgi:NAD-dependent SIR2 family protein deacetylase